MKKITLLLLVLVFILSACASSLEKVQKVVETVIVEAEPEVSVFREAQDGKPFRYTHWGNFHPVYKIMGAGFLQACEDYGLICELTNTDDFDDAKLIAMMETLNTDNTSGIVTGMYFPSRWEAGITAINKGIPVVGDHVPVLDRENVPGLVAWSAPDIIEFARNAGIAMAEKLECAGPVANSQSQLAENESVITDNFREAFLGVCPDTEVLETRALGLELSDSIPNAAAIITAHPDLVGAFSATGDGAQSWAKAAQERGKEAGEIVIVGMDYTRPNLDLVKSGEVWMLVGQPLYEEMYYSVVLLANHLLGIPVPYGNYLPAPQVTLENIDQFYAINDFAESIGE